jgi:hypothetical protein
VSERLLEMRAGIRVTRTRYRCVRLPRQTDECGANRGLDVRGGRRQGTLAPKTVLARLKNGRRERLRELSLKQFEILVLK